MNERISKVDKKPEVANRNPASQIRSTIEHSHSMNSPVDRILFLQRTIGNQAVQKLVKSGTLQAKLRIGQPGDVYEQEADRVAEHVMKMPDVSEVKDTRIQRKCPKCLKGLSGLLGKDKKEDKLQAKEISGRTPDITSHTEANINALKGGGKPLPESTRAFFEPRFGRDFSQVRVHTDTKAAESARAVNAKAYTVGHNVVFGGGQFAPETATGRRMVAHELVHTLQQNKSGNVMVNERTSSLILQPKCNEHGTEEFYKKALNYCKDTGFSGSLHPGQRCYREVPKRTSYWQCPPGDQVCFDSQGICHDSFDRVSTVEKKNPDGTCNLHGYCFIGHAAKDIVPGLLEEMGQRQIECIKMCEKLPWYSRGFCLQGCSPGPY